MRAATAAAVDPASGMEVPVPVVGEAHGRLTEAGADHLGVLAGGDQMSAVSVAEVVKSDSRQPAPRDPAFEDFGNGLGVQRLAIRPAEHEIPIRPSSADEEPTLVLNRSVPTEDRDRLRIEFDSPPALVGLWSVGKVELVVYRHQLSADEQLGRVEVDVGPPKAADFPSAHTPQRSQAEEREQLLLLDLGQEPRQLVGRPPGHLRRSGRRGGRRIGVSCDVSRHNALAGGVGESLAKDRVDVAHGPGAQPAPAIPAAGGE
jgi:hypothetical protein